jgi:hypothetical protein
MPLGLMEGTDVRDIVNQFNPTPSHPNIYPFALEFYNTLPMQ